MSVTKVVAVTGASRGIGSGIVKELASHGHVIGCLSRKGIGPEDQEVAGRLMTLPCDMENEEQISNAINELVKETGRIDVLINNAALHLEGVTAQFSKEDFDKVLRRNITGPFLACR